MKRPTAPLPNTPIKSEADWLEVARIAGYSPEQREKIEQIFCKESGEKLTRNELKDICALLCAALDATTTDGHSALATGAPLADGDDAADLLAIGRRFKVKVVKMLRLPEVLERYGKKETSYREAMASGLVPMFVQLGGRCIGVPEHELDQVIRARIAGLSDEEVRKLVARIHDERIRAAKELIGGAA